MFLNTRADILTGLETLGARVEYHDAHVPELAIEGRGHKSVELTDKALGTADLVIITTDHPEVDYGRVAALAPRVRGNE